MQPIVIFGLWNGIGSKENADFRGWRINRSPRKKVTKNILSGSLISFGRFWLRYTIRIIKIISVFSYQIVLFSVKRLESL